jgi:tetratricopeptide (TPR) repeat protein
MFYQAINEYKKVLSVDKNNATALSNLGLAYMNLEKYSEAVYFLVQAVQINPNKANFRYSLASVYRDRRMFNEAVSEYQKVIDLDSGYPNVHNDLGDIYIAEGKSEEARKEYQEEVSLCQQKLLGNPRDPFTLKDLSYAFSKLKDYQNALNNIKKAIAIKPDYQEAHLLLALIQRELKEYDNAMNSLEKARSFSRQKQLFIDNEIGRVKKDLETYYQSRAKYEPLDEVYLKNGGMFRGTIQKEDNNRIILEISIGKSTGTVILYRDDIKQIVKAEKN